MADELAHLLSDSGSVALIGERSLLAEVDRDRLPDLAHVLSIDDDADAGPHDDPPRTVPYEEALAAASPERGFPPRSSDDHYLLYTGGTTGLPKGVVWRCEDIFIAAMGGGNYGGPPIERPEELAKAADAEPGRAQVHAPLMHGGGQWITWVALTNGGTVVLWAGRHFDPRGALELAAREKSHVLMVVGDGMARPLAAELANGGPGGLELFAFASGGAPLSDDVKDLLLAARPGAVITDVVGGSETGAGGPSLGGGRFQFGPEFAVLDSGLRPVGPGEEGILARTGHVPLAYWGDEEKTAETFVTRPDGRRWVLQGDHARVLDDGTVLLLGRGSLVISTGGEKVFAEEVETILRAHPAVTDAVVVGVPDDRFGQRVTAVVTTQQAGLTLEDLVAHCRGRLAGYKIPRAVTFVPEIQRTAVGKLDYAWARSLFSGPSPAAHR